MAIEHPSVNGFVTWVSKNYSHTKGGYRHRGDFEKKMTPLKLEALKDLYLNFCAVYGK